MSVKSLLKLSSIGNTLLILVALFLSISLVRNVFRMQQAKSSLNQSKEALDKLEDENKELQRQLENVKTERYSEKEARDKLNLAKEGEIVLVLPDDDVLRKLSPRRKEEQEHLLPDPNWKKWLSLFL